jgi:hypothetical protein
LPNYIADSIKEYNSDKPNYIHKIYTPDEIYEEPELKETQLFFDKLNEQKIQNNRNCTGGKACSSRVEKDSAPNAVVTLKVMSSCNSKTLLIVSTFGVEYCQ